MAAKAGRRRSRRTRPSSSCSTCSRSTSHCSRWRGPLLSLSVDGEDVPVGVLEPGRLEARALENALHIRGHTTLVVVALELDALPRELFADRVEIADVESRQGRSVAPRVL